MTVAEDLHARAVAHEIRNSGAHCYRISADSLAFSRSLSWECEVGPGALVPTSDGPVDVATLDAIWWRRFHAPDKAKFPHLTAGQLDVVRNDCKTTLRGILLTRFTGSWISHPMETELADNKLVQLQAASAVGFRLPRTLVSNDPARIRDFCRTLNNQVVVKVVHGARTSGGIPTRMINDEVLEDTDSLAACPTIYQEYVPGTRHIRAHVFGDTIHTVTVESERVDWRVDHTTPISPWIAPAHLSAMLHQVVRRLGLAMGIIDLKLDLDGQPMWLELNPQGQFLFVEALSGVPLTELMANFLVGD